MTIDVIRTLIDYNYARHEQLWTSIDYLSDEQFIAETDYSLKSIRNHMVHVMDADTRWLARIQEAPVQQHLAFEDFSTREATRAHWDTVVHKVKTYVESATDEDLNRPLTFRTSRLGEPAVNVNWQILMHIVNHGTDHRAQVLQLLHHFGAPTLEQDLMLYLWSRRGSHG